MVQSERVSPMLLVLVESTVGTEIHVSEEVADDVPVHDLPIHAQNLAQLRKLCKDITQSPLAIEAHVLCTTPKSGRGQVTTVCLSGAPELVHKSRETILNDTPLSLVHDRS